jgi:hypothetical protein
MKAKEYLDLYYKGKQIADFIPLFIEETKSLIKIRHAKSDSAIDSIIREMNQKWLVLCKLNHNFVSDDYMTQIKKEEFAQHEEKQVASLGLQDTMCDILALQNASKNEAKLYRK